jgi:hypothetical protein
MMMKKSITSVAVLAFILIGISCTQSCSRLQTMLENSTRQQENGESSDNPAQPADVILEAGEDFESLVEDVQSMRRSRIENMSSENLRNLVAPLLLLIENSPLFSQETLSELENNHQKSASEIRTMGKSEYSRWSNSVVQTVRSGSAGEASREYDAEELREILLQINQNADSREVCSALFNFSGDSVYLSPGENMNAANMVCPQGTVFVLLPGFYNLAMVESSKSNNSWAGVGRTVLEGQLTMERAFSGGLNGNTIRGLEINNYMDFGIYSAGIENLVIKDVDFTAIAVDKNGQSRGAVMLFDVENVEITESNFSNVASSVRFVSSRGPLQVTGNSAVNSGRNFFQCDKCNGGGIRINGNSMDHKEQIGTQPLEDWINIYQSNGLENDPIQVNNNRARGHSESKSGSFIMLGDSGGSHQLARGNIGVNPGQVGIGIAGGSDISVENNRMFSEAWDGSNVAYYSALYSEECGNHLFSLTGNVAHWRDSNGRLNRSWTDEKCGVSMGQIRSRVKEDREMDAEIWNDWQP